MQVHDNIRSALRALRANKLRSILTMLGIIIGVSAVISLLSIGQGVENFINSQFNALGTNLLFVMSKLGNSQSAQFAAQFANQTTLTQGDANALGDPRQLPDVASSTALIRLNALARFRDAKLTTTIQGGNEAYLAMRKLEVAEGRGLTEEDVLGAARVAIIGQTVLTELFPPDTDPLNQFVRLNDVPFRVIGVLPEKGGNQFANEDNQIIVPLTAARIYLRDIRARNGLPGVSTILMQGEDPATNAALARIRVTNTDRLLKVGMFAEGRIPIQERRGVLVVPPSAVSKTDEGPFVYVVSGEVASRTPVKLGLETTDGVELLSGVKEGQKVLTSSVHGLGERARLAKAS